MFKWFMEFNNQSRALIITVALLAGLVLVLGVAVMYMLRSDPQPKLPDTSEETEAIANTMNQLNQTMVETQQELSDLKVETAVQQEIADEKIRSMERQKVIVVQTTQRSDRLVDQADVTRRSTNSNISTAEAERARCKAYPRPDC